MAITRVADGTPVNTTTTTLSLVAPTIVAGDILIANIVTHDNTAITGQDARWIQAYSANNTAAQRATVYWMIAALADSGATFNFTIAGTTAGLGNISAYRGADAVGAITSSANASSATVTWAALTSTSPGSAIISLAQIGIQTGSDGGMSAGTPTFTNRYYSSQGTTDAIALYDALTPFGIGSTGARTMNNTQAAVNTGVLLELIPTIVAAGGVSGGQGFVKYPPLRRLRESRG